VVSNRITINVIMEYMSTMPTHMHDPADLITHEELLKIFEYDPGTELWRWLKRINPNCKMGIWQAGWATADQYKHVKIYGKQYHVARLAWFYVKGAWPTQEAQWMYDLVTEAAHGKFWYRYGETTWQTEIDAITRRNKIKACM
jgi:hypothetical protein